MPEGSQSSDRLRLKGYGVSSTSTKVKGNQIVHLKVSIPKPSELSSEECEYLRKFYDLRSGSSTTTESTDTNNKESTASH